MWYLLVRCKHCGKIQKTRALKRRVCVYCGRSFKIIDEKEGKHAIVKTVGITPEQIVRLRKI